MDPKVKTMQTAFSIMEVHPTTTRESDGNTNVTTITARTDGEGVNTMEGQTERPTSVLRTETCEDIGNFIYF